jgi:GNAT superfamily N-acetyltransferase
MTDSIPASTVQFRPAQITEDAVIAQHFYQLWRDNQIGDADINPNWQRITQEFITDARQKLSFQAFVAEVDQQIVGSASCQLFAGLYPQILLETQRKYGYIWNVYVESGYRGRGLGKGLTTCCVEYLKSLGCTRAILHASPFGKPIYTQLGFNDSNEMRLDLV